MIVQDRISSFVAGSISNAKVGVIVGFFPKSYAKDIEVGRGFTIAACFIAACFAWRFRQWLG